MTKAVRPNDAAEAEFRHYIRWYEGESAGLGDRLWSEIQAMLSLIANFPSIGETVRQTNVREVVRRIPLRHFPFRVVYREFPDYIEVVALAHTSREPHYWQNRLQ